MLVVSGFVFLDALKVKSGVLIVIDSICITGTSIISYNLFSETWIRASSIGLYHTRERVYLYDTVDPTVYIHTNYVIQYERHLYPI